MDLGKLFPGLALLFIGIALISLSSFQSISYGAVVLIGPFPFVVSSDVGLAIFLLLLSVLILILIQIMRWGR